MQPVECSSERIDVGSNEWLLLFNVYMPCDTRTRGSNLDEFISVLDKISILINRYDPEFSIIGGDFVDFSRSTPETYVLVLFLEQNSLYKIPFKNFYLANCCTCTNQIYINYTYY